MSQPKGIQSSIIKDIGRAIAYPHGLGMHALQHRSARYCLARSAGAAELSEGIHVVQWIPWELSERRSFKSNLNPHMRICNRHRLLWR
jgi:hypothetical protein